MIRRRHPEFILASASPQRRSLLERAGFSFRQMPSGAPERSEARSPAGLVAEVALRKARAVAARLRARGREPSLVLGADTIVVCAGRTLLKPADRAEGLAMLRALNGRWHRVYTGVAVVDPADGRSWTAAVATKVKARRLADAALRRLAGRNLDKAGGYAAQDAGDPFIERVEGPLDNVVGLPVACAARLLANAARARTAGRVAAPDAGGRVLRPHPDGGAANSVRRG